MQNQCECDLTVKGPSADLATFSQHIKSQTREFDFNKIVPMPLELLITDSTSGDCMYTAQYGSDTAIAELLNDHWFKVEGAKDRESLVTVLAKRDPKARKLAEQYKRNHDQYGYTTWYEWSVDNWGTKWNAMDVKVREAITHPCTTRLRLSFGTAWQPPIPVIEKAAAMFPTLCFTMDYYEGAGGTGGFAGRLIAERGQTIEDDRRAYSGPRGG